MRSPTPPPIQYENESEVYDREAEALVLGAIIVDANIMPDIMALLGETSAAFDTTDHKLIYDAIVHTWKNKNSTDFKLIAEKLKADGDLKRIGGGVYIYDLQSRIVETSTSVHHATIVRDNWLRRTLQATASELGKLAIDKTQDLIQILNTAQQKVFQLSAFGQTKGFSNIKNLIEETVDELEDLYSNPDKSTGTPTSYIDYDALTEGLHPGETTVLAARPSIGKTTLALNIAANIAQDTNVSVAIFSLEMTRKELVKRILSRQSDVTFTKIRAPRLLLDEEWPRVIQAKDRLLENSNIHINDTKRMKISAISAEARKLKQNNPDLCMVVIDYLQLIRSDKDREVRDREVSEISNEIKALASELDLPIIAISQLNRAAENQAGTDKSPKLHQLRESGSIEQDADNVAFLYRDPKNNNDRLGYDIIDIIFRKQRNGPQGDFKLEFHKDYMRFDNLRLK